MTRSFPSKTLLAALDARWCGSAGNIEETRLFTKAAVLGAVGAVRQRSTTFKSLRQFKVALEALRWRIRQRERQLRLCNLAVKPAHRVSLTITLLQVTATTPSLVLLVDYTLVASIHERSCTQEIAEQLNVALHCGRWRLTVATSCDHTCRWPFSY